MFDELKTIVSQLREVSLRIDVSVIDGKSAAKLVRISEDARRTIDGLSTSAIGRVGTTEAWRVGGSQNFANIAEYADGWLPIGGAGIKSALPELEPSCEEAGRDFSEMRIIPFGTLPDPGKLDYYPSLGIEEVVLRLPGGDADSVRPILDGFAELVEA